MELAWNSKDVMRYLLSICIFCICSELLRDKTVKSVLCVILNIVFFQYALIFLVFFRSSTVMLAAALSLFFYISRNICVFCS